MELNGYTQEAINEKLRKSYDEFGENAKEIYAMPLNSYSKEEIAILKAAIVEADKKGITIADGELARELKSEAEVSAIEDGAILIGAKEGSLETFLGESSEYTKNLVTEMKSKEINPIKIGEQVITMDIATNLYNKLITNLKETEIPFEISFDEMTKRIEDHEKGMPLFLTNGQLGVPISVDHKFNDAFHNEAIIAFFRNSASKYDYSDKDIEVQNRSLGYEIAHDMNNPEAGIRIIADTQYADDIGKELNEYLSVLEKMPASEKYKVVPDKDKADEFERVINECQSDEEKLKAANKHLAETYKDRDPNAQTTNALLSYIHSSLVLRVFQLQHERDAREQKKMDNQYLSRAAQSMNRQAYEKENNVYIGSLLDVINDASSGIDKDPTKDKDWGKEDRTSEDDERPWG